MIHRSDFTDSHRRHWHDAELLYRHACWPNADQLYGFSAECGLKAVMHAQGMPVDATGKPTSKQHQRHIQLLWSTFVSFANGRNGARYVQLLPVGKPFHDWSHHNRYAHGRHFPRTDIEPHREAARRVCRMVRQARQDGLLLTQGLVLFDRIKDRVADVLASCPSLATLDRLYVVRDLLGKVRICVSDSMETDESRAQVLQDLARRLHEALGAHGYPADDTIVFLDSAMLQSLDDAARELQPGVFWVDRLVTGRDWWSVGRPYRKTGADRYTLFSVKGGVGRSTSAVMLAWRLARNGERVLVVDLALESPGLSSAMLDSGNQPEFGITDWFVEDLVAQGASLVERMTAVPSWAHDLEGDVHVATAHGREPGEYLAKLGRVHMDTDDPWTRRLEHLLSQLEEMCDPSIVLLESRSGLHDIAAATVTDLDAQVLLFAVDSDSHWTDYRILFRHWQTHGLARAIRERLSIVSALTPELDTERYLRRFRERAWDLFREHLYDDVAPSEELGDAFSFDALEEDAPHVPMVIHWTRGLAAGASLLDPERTTAGRAYAQFFARFDGLIAANRSGETQP